MPSPASDVFVALKRTLGRLGAWPWDPDGYDRNYSNGFAHGSENGPGIAGVQKWAKLDPSGWIGEPTWNFLAVGAGAGRQAARRRARDRRLLREPDPERSEGPAGARVEALGEAHPEGDAEPELFEPRRRHGAADRAAHRRGRNDDRVARQLLREPVRRRLLARRDRRPAGVVGEYVKRDGKAWTAANANPVAVQAELCAFAKWDRDEWDEHPNMLENCARWIAEEAAAFGLPLAKLTPAQAQGSGRGVCQHNDLGSWGGGHWDCGPSFPIDDVLNRAKEWA